MSFGCLSWGYFCFFWTAPDCWDAHDIALEMSDTPNILTDGSGEDFSSTGGFEVAGAVVYIPAAELAFEGSVWGAVLFCLSLGHCRLFSVLNFWGAVLALQSHWPCHLGIDNLNVAWSIGRLLDHGCLVKPLPLVRDGDLFALAQYMRPGGGIRLGSPRSKGMLQMLTLSTAVFRWKTSWAMRRLMLLLV